MRHVIVGAGPAGVVAAETIRRREPGAEITLIGGEAGEPYARMAIPYFLTGKIGENGAALRKTRDHYKALNIRVVSGRAAKLDAQKRELTLADGTRLPFDRLLIATGASAVSPPIPGIDLSGVHNCWTLDDARAIVARAQKGADVVLIGAGFIGGIILESLVERGVKLTVIESESRMLPKMMDDAGGALIRHWCESKGITVLTGTRTKGIEKAGGKLAVVLDKGAALPADLVVVATGVKANTDFLAGSGIALDGGVVVDSHLSAHGDVIFAAGDCARGPDFSGGFMVHAIQPTAVEHGRIAAVNMTGGNARYKGSLIMNVLDTAGLISASFGHWQGGHGGEEASALDAGAFRYTHLSFADGRLVGALVIGRTDHVGAIRGLIQCRTPLGAWKARLMRDPTRVAEAFVSHVS